MIRMPERRPNGWDFRGYIMKTLKHIIVTHFILIFLSFQGTHVFIQKGFLPEPQKSIVKMEGWWELPDLTMIILSLEWFNLNKDTFLAIIKPAKFQIDVQDVKIRATEVGWAVFL